jgi:hypothetical protein
MTPATGVLVGFLVGAGVALIVQLIRRRTL